MNGLRAARDQLVADTSLRGVAFGRALAGVVDAALGDAAAAIPASLPYAVVALGSYARRELCPGSDVDVMFLHASRGDAVVEAAHHLWYPMWDADFVLGQSVRTVKEALALADADVDALTAFLDLRVVAGDASLAHDLGVRLGRLVSRRRDRLVQVLADAAERRGIRPGPIAEMLEPDLKDGAGGLRDLAAPGWIGHALRVGPPVAPSGWDGGVEQLVADGYLEPDDVARLRDERATLLDARVAHHRVTGSRSDRLALQDQDAVARGVGAAGADEFIRGVGEAARAVVWITSDMWARLRATQRGPTGRGGATRVLGDGVLLRDGRLALSGDAPVDATIVLELAARAAQLGAAIERNTLRRIGELTDVAWTVPGRDAFLALLAAGRDAIPVVESLDHVGVLVRLLPEWAYVRARPQRNAYHRFTVDRHSLEAVAECAALLDAGSEAGDGYDSEIARRTRADVLLLAALLHDFGKGQPGDHSAVGAEIARTVATRVGIDEPGIEQLVWLVGDHLLLADTATRRDLSDEHTIRQFTRAVGDLARNDLLYAFTIADSRATGPAAWNASKAALVRELHAKASAVLASAGMPTDPVAERLTALTAMIGAASAREFLDAMPAAYATAFAPRDLARHHELVERGELAVDWEHDSDEWWRCTVVAPDRSGLLAMVAATLALAGLDITSAAGYTHASRMALEVFAGVDRFGRLADAAHRASVRETLAAALAGDIDVEARLLERTRRYRTRPAHVSVRDVQVLVDPEASPSATVVEVHAPDDLGLLARIASVFPALDLDVVRAIASTQGDRVVDVFYLRDVQGRPLVPGHAIEALRATLLARLTSEVTLDASSPPPLRS